ncbi:MAG: AAA family ATPase, partial [Candidatus Asgardarchaeia archaeon]
MFIKSMTIRNFRGIRECSIDDFSDVNLFIGRNGSGKSTILESIYLSSAWVNSHDVLRGQKKIDFVISRRTGRGKWISSRDVLWFLMDTVKDIEIGFTYTNNDKLEFKLINFDNEGRIWLPIPQRMMMKYPIKEYGYHNYSSDYFVSVRSRTFKPKPYREYFAKVYTDIISFLEKVTLIDPNILANPQSIENKTWPRILSKRLDKLIV